MPPYPLDKVEGNLRRLHGLVGIGRTSVDRIDLDHIDLDIVGCNLAGHNLGMDHNIHPVAHPVAHPAIDLVVDWSNRVAEWWEPDRLAMNLVNGLVLDNWVEHRSVQRISHCFPSFWLDLDCRNIR